MGNMCTWANTKVAPNVVDVQKANRIAATSRRRNINSVGAVQGLNKALKFAQSSVERHLPMRRWRPGMHISDILRCLGAYECENKAIIRSDRESSHLTGIFWLIYGHPGFYGIWMGDPLHDDSNVTQHGVKDAGMTSQGLVFLRITLTVMLRDPACHDECINILLPPRASKGCPAACISSRMRSEGSNCNLSNEQTMAYD